MKKHIYATHFSPTQLQREVILFSTIPPLVLWMLAGRVPPHFHYLVLGVIFILLLIRTYARYTEGQLSLQDLGLKPDWKDAGSFWIHLSVAAAGALIIRAVSYETGNSVLNFETRSDFFKLLNKSILLSGPQEFLYRTYFFATLAYAGVTIKRVAVLNVLVFSLLHVFYQDWVGFGLACFGGVIFMALFIAYKNLPYILFVHVVYNFTILFSGHFKV